MNENSIENQSLSFNDLIFLIKRKLLLIILLTAFTTTVAAIYGCFIKDITYSATNTSYVEVPIEDTNNNLGSAYQASVLILNTYKELILTQSVLHEAVELLKELYPNVTKNELKGSISVSVPASSLLVFITASTDSPDKSIAYANAIVESSIKIVNQKNDEGDPIFKTLNSNVAVIENAFEASESRGATIVIALGLFIGLFLSFGIILILYISDNTFSSKKLFEETFGINILACLKEAESEGSL